MRIVVTGATGNIGTALVRRLAAERRVAEIVGLARRLPAMPRPAAAARVRYLNADVARDELEPVFRGAAAVVHLAWLFQPAHRPEVTWRANVQGSARVFAAAERAGVAALVYSSSVGAYSPGRSDAAVDESWPTHGLPTAGYGREKAYVPAAARRRGGPAPAVASGAFPTRLRVPGQVGEPAAPAVRRPVRPRLPAPPRPAATAALPRGAALPGGARRRPRRRVRPGAAG